MSHIAAHLEKSDHAVEFILPMRFDVNDWDIVVIDQLLATIQY